MAAPSFCSYNLPWKEKYVLVRQNSNNHWMCLTAIVVLWCKLVSSSRSFFMMFRVGCMGMEVNRDLTSKDIIQSSSSIVISCMFCMKSWLFLTWCVDLPTSGLSILDNSLAVSYVADLMLETIGLNGVSSLCTLEVHNILVLWPQLDKSSCRLSHLSHLLP